MKADGLLERNHLAGAIGDAINAVLAAAGHNLRLLAAWLRKLLRALVALLFAVAAPSDHGRHAAARTPITLERPSSRATRYLSHRIFTGLPAIVDACAKAWNDLLADKSRVASLTDYSYLEQVGIS